MKFCMLVDNRWMIGDEGWFTPVGQAVIEDGERKMYRALGQCGWQMRSCHIGAGSQIRDGMGNLMIRRSRKAAAAAIGRTRRWAA